MKLTAIQQNVSVRCSVQGSHGQGKYLENDFFQVAEKSGNFVASQVNLERTWKVRKNLGNLKINGSGNFLENLFILFNRGKDVLSHVIV